MKNNWAAVGGLAALLAVALICAVLHWEYGLW